MKQTIDFRLSEASTESQLLYLYTLLDEGELSAKHCKTFGLWLHPAEDPNQVTIRDRHQSSTVDIVRLTYLLHNIYDLPTGLNDKVKRVWMWACRELTPFSPGISRGVDRYGKEVTLTVYNMDWDPEEFTLFVSDNGYRFLKAKPGEKTSVSFFTKEVVLGEPGTSCSTILLDEDVSYRRSKDLEEALAQCPQVKNTFLARKALETIEANPSHWNQSHWHCDTSHCFAGFVELLHLGLSPDCTSREVHDRNIECTGETAERLLGITRDDAEELFNWTNTLDDLRSLVGNLFPLVP